MDNSEYMAIGDCALCGYEVCEADVARTSRGLMHEVCAESIYVNIGGDTVECLKSSR